MSSPSESFEQLPLQAVPRAYLYDQYSDDEDLQSFFSTLTAFGQGYMDWATNTPLAVWTNPNINGQLLDWTAQSLYGIVRPVISTSSSKTTGVYGTRAYGTGPAYGMLLRRETGTAIIANDDIYKRVITWVLYQGDADNIDITWLKKRIARFLYGADGSDFDIGLLNNISINPTMMLANAGYGRNPYGMRPAYGMMLIRQTLQIQLNITIPNTPASQILSDFLTQGILPMPTQCTYTVTIS